MSGAVSPNLGANAGQGGLAPPASGPSIAGVSIDLLNKSVTDDVKRIYFDNMAMRPIPPSDYSLDTAAGVVAFHAPVGHLANRNIETPEQGRIESAPRVRVTFAYEDSPDAREALAQLADTGGPKVGGGPGQLPPAARGTGEVAYHFNALYNRGASGGMRLLNAGLRDPPLGEDAKYPQTVHDDGLRLFVALDGKSNEAELYRRARDIAEPLLSAPDDYHGEDGEAIGFFPILPSSKITHVEWEGGDGRCFTRWSVENVAARKALQGRPDPGRIVR